MYKVGLYTLGCKVSLYETEAIAEKFEEFGFSIEPFDSVCDVYVINTCTVTAESDAKSRKYIRRAIRKNPSGVVCVVGCYSQRSPQDVANIPGVSVVIGTQDKLSVVELAIDHLEGRRAGQTLSVGSLESASFEEMSIIRAPRIRAYVKIQDGCECKCTYCAISSARGPVRSKKPSAVFDEVRTLSESGVREIVFTGIETGSYGADFKEKYDLADLLCDIDKLGVIDRIRLGSMAPELLSEHFISRVGSLGSLVPHFHVSMQSGSDNVLKRMKRRYSLASAIANLERIRQYMPKTMFTADLMVGFPGETEEDFLATVNFVNRVKLLDAHVFAYSRREGTVASEYADQIPEDIKNRRSAMLISEKNKVRDSVLSEIVEKREPLSCIFESRLGNCYTAHSDSYVEVRCIADRDVSGEIFDVIPVSHKDGIIYGEIKKYK